MCRTTDFSFHCSKLLNNTGVWSLAELESLYTVPLSAVNGLSRLTTTSNGQARPIRKFSNRPITFESNRIGTADSNSNRISKLRRSLCHSHAITVVCNHRSRHRHHFHHDYGEQCLWNFVISKHVTRGQCCVLIGLNAAFTICREREITRPPKNQNPLTDCKKISQVISSGRLRLRLRF